MASQPGGNGTAGPAQPDDPFARIAELLDFPADFPVKVMGLQDSRFAAAIGELVCQHIPTFNTDTITATQSRTGKYTSLTLPLRVESREQLENLYKALADHPMVRIVL